MEAWFSFGGAYSVSLGIIITAAPSETIPERDVETVSIPGRNGDLTIDNGRWKNTKRSYSCALLPESRETYRWEYNALADFLRPSAGYSRLEDSFNPGLFRLARAVGGIDVSSVMDLAGKFTVEFNCKPQRYLKSGESTITFSAPGELRNPTSYQALPLIYAHGSGAGSLTLGSTTVNITEMPSSPLIIDCEQMNAYSRSAAGAVSNKNSTIMAPAFPCLEPGANIVSWSGEITSVEIIPRWWTL